MSGPFGPECDDLLLAQRRAAAKNERSAYVLGLIIGLVCAAALAVVVIIDGPWRWLSLASAITVWFSAAVLTFGAWTAEP